MDDIKQKIILSASRQFMKHGCKRITMDDVAHELGMSKRTLYEQFANKEELLKACLEVMNTKIREAHARIEATHESPLVCTILIGKLHEHYSKKYQHVVEDLQRYYPDLMQEACTPQTKEGMLMMERWLATSAEKGYIRKDVDLKLAAMTINMVLEHLLSATMMFDYSQSETINEFMFNYMRGLLSVQALEEYERQKPDFMTQLQQMKFD